MDEIESIDLFHPEKAMKWNVPIRSLGKNSSPYFLWDKEIGVLLHLDS